MTKEEIQSILEMCRCRITEYAEKERNAGKSPWYESAKDVHSEMVSAMDIVSCVLSCIGIDGGNSAALIDFWCREDAEGCHDR